MSSNHITYEPLTWAKFHPAQKGFSVLSSFAEIHRSRSRTESSSPKSWTGTQERDHRSSLSKVEAIKVDLSSSPIAQNQQRAVKFGGSNENEILAYEWQSSDMLSEYNNNTSQEYGTESDNRVDGSIDDNSVPQQRESVGLLSNSFSDISNNENDASSSNNMEHLVLSMLDRGLYDGIKRVLFGGANHHWLNRILLLDAIEHLSSGRILVPLDRYVQIDIDDIFVGEQGKRMSTSDVDALVDTQRKFASRIEGGFKFNLGYSGKYFKHGNEVENLGDARLVERASEFTWFCHTWAHTKAHLFNDSESIATELRKNLAFASEHGLPIIGYPAWNTSVARTASSPPPPTYAIAPHHSGGK